MESTHGLDREMGVIIDSKYSTEVMSELDATREMGWGGPEKQSLLERSKVAAWISVRVLVRQAGGSRWLQMGAPYPGRVYTGSLKCDCGTPASVQGNSLGCRKKRTSLFTLYLVV